MKVSEEQKRKFMKEFREVFTSMRYNVEFDEGSNYTRITHPKIKYYVYTAEFDEASNFIRCIKNMRGKGIIKRIKSASEVMEWGFLFGMLVSKEVYGGINLEIILRDRYIIDFKIEDKIKLFFADYVRNAIMDVRYAGTDGEGCRYNTCNFVNVY